jgi:ribosomal protein S18 acetylase RimI-like enzyme
MTQLQFRPATDDDIEFLFRLHKATLHDAVDRTWGWDDDWQWTYFNEHWNPQELLIVIWDGVDIGVLKLDQREDELFLSLIEIDPTYQGQGIGTTIIQNIIADAYADGFPVTLHCLRVNHAARRLYERLGFYVYDEDPERCYMRADQS